MACAVLRSRVAATPLGDGVDLGPGGAQRRVEPVLRALDLLADRGAELGGEEQLAQHRCDRGVLGQVGRGEAVDEGLRRRVGDEAANELAGQVLRGGGVPGQEVQQRLAVALRVRDTVLVVGPRRSAPCAAQDRHRVLAVPPLGEPVRVAVGTVIPVDGPAGQDLRHSDDVGLGVHLGAADDAEGVQLEQLTPVVLVHLLAGLALAREVVQVHQHRRALRRRHQQVGEPAQRVAPHDLLVVEGLELRQPLGPAPDVEVVGPEVAHHLEQLAFGVDRPLQRGVVELGEDQLLVGGAHGLVLGVGLAQRRVPPTRASASGRAAGDSGWSSQAAGPLRRIASTVAAVAPKVARFARWRAEVTGVGATVVVGAVVGVLVGRGGGVEGAAVHAAATIPVPAATSSVRRFVRSSFVGSSFVRSTSASRADLMSVSG